MAVQAVKVIQISRPTVPNFFLVPIHLTPMARFDLIQSCPIL